MELPPQSRLELLQTKVLSRKQAEEDNTENTASKDQGLPFHHHQSEVLRKFSKHSDSLVVDRHDDKFKGVSCSKSLKAHGIRKYLINLAWWKVLLLIAVLYLTIASTLASLLYITHKKGNASSGVSVITWLYRGFFLLLASPEWAPTTTAEHCVAILGGYSGSMFTLCLFGVIYEKFAKDGKPIVFAKAVTLRQVTLEDGKQYPLMTFRYANLNGQPLINANSSAMALRRVHLGHGEYVFVQAPVDLSFTKTGKAPVKGHVKDITTLTFVPPVFFLHHLVTEDSPFWGLDFTSKEDVVTKVPRLFVTIDGWTRSHDQIVSSADWGPGAVKVDCKFKSIAQGKTAKDFDLTHLSDTEPVVYDDELLEILEEGTSL